MTQRGAGVVVTPRDNTIHAVAPAADEVRAEASKQQSKQNTGAIK